MLPTQIIANLVKDLDRDLHTFLAFLMECIQPPLGSKGEYIILGSHPTPSTAFHPKALFFACAVPAIEGTNQNWCS